MTIDIYHSKQSVNDYLAVRSGSDVTKLQLEPSLASLFSKVCPFKSQHTIEAGLPYIGLDSIQVITDIESKGYATFGANVSITITEGVEPPK
jgi:hypothetical protein